MKKQGFKRLTKFFAGLFASLLVIPGIVTMCVGINGTIVDNKYVEAKAETNPQVFLTGTALYVYGQVAIGQQATSIKVPIVVEAPKGTVVYVKFRTFDINAIAGIDYTAREGTVSFTVTESAGIHKDNIVIQVNNNPGSRQYYRAWKTTDSRYDNYGRRFGVELLDAYDSIGNPVDIADNPTPTDKHRLGQFRVVQCGLPYDYSEMILDGGVKGGKQITYASAYNGDYYMYGGTDALDGGSTWKSWKKDTYNPISYINDYAPYYVDRGMAEVYGTWAARVIDDDDFTSSSDIKCCFGNEEFIQKYDGPELDTPGQLLFFDVNPKNDGDERFDNQAMSLISRKKNPYKTRSKLVNCEYKAGVPESELKDFYWCRDSGSNWLWSVNQSIPMTWFKLKPYNGKYNLGVAVKNYNKEYDREVKDVICAAIIRDEHAPVVTNSYVVYDQDTAKIRIYLRFNETVYSSYHKDLSKIKINDRNTDYYAKYIAGDYSDTLVYEMTDVPKMNIRKLTYQFIDEDVGDIAKNPDKNGFIWNNFVANPDQDREATIVGGNIPLVDPELAADPDPDYDPGDPIPSKNVYNITLSANDLDRIDFSEGTVYYAFDHNPSIAYPDKIETYADGYTRVLTEDDNGSFQVTLATEPAGDYYLHALVISKYGFKDYETFGPYRLDNRKPEISQLKPPTDELVNKQFVLECTDKDLNTKHSNITLQVKYTEDGVEKTAKSVLVENKDIVNPLVTDPPDTTTNPGHTRYIYNSDISSMAVKPDNFIKELMGTNKRFVATISFLYEDSAGNKATSNSYKVIYDTRNTFDLERGVPANYVPDTSIDVGENVYNIHTATSSDGMTFTVPSSIVSSLSAGALFYLDVNGTRVDAGSGVYTITLTNAPAGHYEVTGYITESTGEGVALVAKTINYYLTDNMTENTANKAKANGNLVLSNKVFQLQGARYYYYNSINNTLGNQLYGAVYDSSAKKYDGGSSSPSFSNSVEAKKYLRYMEYQDLFLVKINETQAQIMNTGSGSIQFMKADGESKTAQADQLWIRYKRASWRDTSDTGGWALYYYGDGNIADGINYNALSDNLRSAMESVVNTIVKLGTTVYLVDDEHINQSNGAPYLISSQIHVDEERVDVTKSGTPYVTDLIFEGDKNIYQNTITVEAGTYPLATNMPLTIDSSTQLYLKSGETSWDKIETENGTTLVKALSNIQASGHYLIREYTIDGIGEFEFYLDKGVPTLYVFKDSAVSPMVLDSSITRVTCRTLSLKTLTKSGDASTIFLPDDLSYVAIYTYPYKNLIKVLYADEVDGYTLTNGNFYVQVGDRSGNIATYEILTSDTDIELDVYENSEKTGVYVKVENREEEEIYSYEVYINEVLVDTEYAALKLFREAGVYRVVVRDIYGNIATMTLEHDAPTPVMNWYYLNDNGSYSAYDPDNIVRLKVVDSTEDARTTYLYASTLVSVLISSSYETGEIEFEMSGLETSDYTFNPSTGYLSVNSLKTWSLRVWYDRTPENDRTYVFQLDNVSPTNNVTYVGTNLKTIQSVDDIDLTPYEYQDYLTLSSLEYASKGSYTLSVEDNDIIYGSNINVSLNDNSGIKSVVVTRDGLNIDIPDPYDKEKKEYVTNYVTTLNGYGHFIIIATDCLNNISRFEFTNVRDGEASNAFVDVVEVAENTTNYGHDALVVNTLYEGETTILLTLPNGENTANYTYVFAFDGTVLNYGHYYVNKEIVDSLEVKFADFVVDKNVIDLADEGVYKRNTWYQAVRGVYFIVSVLVNDEGQASYKIECVSQEISVETLTAVNGRRILNRYEAVLSKTTSNVALYTDGDPISTTGSAEYIYIAGDLTLAPEAAVDLKITTIEVAYNINPIMTEYKVIYKDGHYLEEFVGEKDGFYEVRVTNIYNNVKVYKISKIDTFNSLVKIHVMDGSDVMYTKYPENEPICSNYSIELIIYSDSVTFYVNDVVTTGYYLEGATILELKRVGDYKVKVVGENGVYQNFLFEIKNDETFLYKEEWITGYNEDALKRDQYYTNTLCDINLDKEAGVVYIDMSFGDDLIRLYDNITDNRMTDEEFLKGAIGRYGNGEYIVGFRNKYGDLVKHTVYYSNETDLVLSRITTSNPDVTEAYSVDLAIEKGFYSNYVLSFSTESDTYIFTINGERVSLETPKTIEFTNISGKGSFSYKVTYIDEYGNNIKFDAILNREDVEIDASTMKTTTLNGELYTKDDIKVTFASDLVATVTVDDGEAKAYQSGQTFYKDGKYKFIVTDISGNQEIYTINHKSVNHHNLYNSANEQSLIQGGVLNNTNVVFTASDDSRIKYVFRNGELQEEYTSNNFTATGHWELVIEDSIGNQSYEEFYLINNSLATFDYTAPYGYEITEVWRVNADGSREILNFKGKSITLKDKGDYAIVVSNKDIASSFNFTITIDNSAPKANLVGVEDGGVTARDVSLTNLSSGDVIKVYKNNQLVSTTTVGLSSTSPSITTSGNYRITVTNIQGVTVEYTFVRRPIASVSASVFIVITCALAVVGMGIGLVYHTKLKSDD